jgi:tetratricopeptide (TPR) repeat protein
MALESFPNNVLVVILGASEWPKAPEFKKSQAFTNSAKKLRDYFLDRKKFGLPEDNLLDLFDSDLSYDEIDETIEKWIAERVPRDDQSAQSFSDLVVIYIGHGGFVNGHEEYFLAIRRTRANNPGASSIPITALARTIKEQARYLRRYIILDCCFAASAFKYFQSAEIAQAATKQALEAFAVAGKGYGIPTRGTSLLCSSRHNKPSLLSPNEEYTMFSEALIHALENGNPQYQDQMPLESICSLAKDYLQDKYKEEAPKPEVHSPDQSEGAVATVPLFPNLAKVKTDVLEVEPSTAKDPITAKQPIPKSGVDKKPTAEEVDISAKINAIRTALKDDQGNAQLHAELGELLLSRKEWYEAERAFEKAIKLKSDVADWHYKLAIAMSGASGVSSKAEDEFGDAVRLEPENLRYRLDYAHFLSRQRKWSRAIPQLEYVLDKDPENDEAIPQLTLAKQQNKLAEESYLKGREYENLGQLDEALDYYRNVHRIEINYKDVNSRLPTLLANTHRDKGITTIQDAIKVAPDKAELYVSLGQLQFDNKNFEEAESAFKRAIELDNKNALYHASLGRVYFSQEKWEAAETEFESALKLDPKNPERQIELGATALAQMDWDRAIRHYEAAQKLSPNRMTSIRLRQNIANAKNNKRHEQLVKSQHHANLGRRYLSQEKLESAEAEFKRALELEPKNPERYLELGATAFAQMQWDAAIRYYEAALKLSSDPVTSFRLQQNIDRVKKIKQQERSAKSLRITPKMIVVAVLFCIIFAAIFFYVKSC